MPRLLRLTAILLALLTSAALGGCKASVTVGKKTLDRAELQHQVATELQRQVGSQQPPTISCPHDLEAKVGAAIDCTLSSSDSTDTYGVHVVVTSVKDGRANFDIKVAHQPN